MEGFSLLLLCAILILLVTLKKDLYRKIEDLEAEIRRLGTVIHERSFNTEVVESPAESNLRKTEEVDSLSKLKEETWESNFKVVEDDESTATRSERIEEWLHKTSNTTAPNEVLEETLIIDNQTTTSSIPKRSSFFERNPDLEKFIGENLISKIGIGILVLAIGYFVKFAIDNNWIGEIGRVAIGLLCGGVLVALAHKLRNSYKPFSSVLLGGGIAVFYFTITLAYHQFHLFSQTTAFIIMLFITAFAVVLSLIYDRQEVAIIALVGGFAAPFMVSDGSGNYRTLFTYLILLNTGLLVIAYNKGWRLLNLLAFIFTVILVSGWLFSLPDNEKENTYANAFVFCTIFYFLFFAINLAHNIKENKKFIASDFGILLGNTSLYFAVGLFCLYNMDATHYKGIFSASMGLLNLVISYVLFRNKKVDINILYLLIGITLTFVSLTAPLQLQGNYITLFWASETVLLYWLFKKSSIDIFRKTSLIVYGTMLISLLMDWFNIYSDTSKALSIIINKGFITTVYSAIATFFLYALVSNDPTAQEQKALAVNRKNWFAMALVLLFMAGFLEINYQFQYHYPGTSLYKIYLQLYTFSFVLSLLSLVRKTIADITITTEAILLSACVVIYIGMININFSIQNNALELHQYNLHFIVAHWTTAILMALIFIRIIQLVRIDDRISQNNFNNITWLICAIIIIFLSVEFNLLSRSFFYSFSTSLADIQRVYNKAVLPILWGLSSLIFMWLGMRFKFRTLRIISLSLFSLTLAKLFLFDIKNIPIAGKIAAFFCLGVLLLVVSFMYQRLKKIIIEDEQKPVI